MISSNYVSPSVDRGGDMLVNLRESVLSVAFCLSVQQFLLEPVQANTRRWPCAGLMLAHRLRRWSQDVFDITLNAGQRQRRQANINPALFQSIVLV